MASPYTKVANGNIAPSRFVKIDTTAKDRVLQAGAGDKCYGVSQPGVRNAPWAPLDDGYAAIAGENLMIYGSPSKDIKLELGGTVTAGDSLKSDANGKGVTTTTTGDWIGAEAMESGVTGDVVRVRVVEPHQY